jgi:hypothetical protein
MPVVSARSARCLCVSWRNSRSLATNGRDAQVIIDCPKPANLHTSVLGLRHQLFR